MNELWEYPFHAGVWGTASDVVMVLVTAATLWYLIKTLKSQRDVQRLQLKVTRIENERFIREHKLKFDVQTDLKTNYTADPVTTHIDLKLKLLNGDCKDFFITAEGIRCNLILNEGNVFATESIPENSTGVFGIETSINVDIYLNEGSLIEVNIYFSDRVENTFQQKVTLEIGMGKFSVSVDEAAELLTT